MVEIKKMAFADRDAYSGDPRMVSFDVSRLFDSRFAEARRRAIPTRASDRVDAGAIAAATPADTTYLAVVDRDGNAVSLIESVVSEFGSACVAPGSVALLTTRLVGCSRDRAHPDAPAPVARAR